MSVGSIDESMSNADATMSGPATPKFIQPDFERMPLELQRLNNWVLWAAVWNGKKWTKRPIQISGYGASTINKKHLFGTGEIEEIRTCQAMIPSTQALRKRGPSMKRRERPDIQMLL